MAYALKIIEALFKVFPVLEKWIDLKIMEIPMKEMEHKEKTDLREKRIERKLVKVSFRTDRRKKRTEKKREKKDIDVQDISKEENE